MHIHGISPAMSSPDKGAAQHLDKGEEILSEKTPIIPIRLSPWTSFSFSGTEEYLRSVLLHKYKTIFLAGKNKPELTILIMKLSPSF